MNLHVNDKILLGAMATLWAAATAYGAAGDAFGLPLALGALLMFAAWGVAAAGRGALASRLGLPVLGMAMVALLIHAARGRTEAHFAVFAFLACTVVYRDWRAVVSAAATIAVHHLSFNFLQQWGWGAICFTQPGIGLVLEHAAYVVAEAAMLMLLAARARADAAAGEELAQVATRLKGDGGTVDFAAARLPVRDPVARELVAALRRIEDSIAQVRHSADSISTAAREITSGNGDLSRRTETASASLQQTAGSMEQITGTVRGTADAARNASQLAGTAHAVANKGGEAVAQVVATMNEINASSRRIGDIIGTIDGIAFQTNILALNAAVEAARAGEQGRGFAVVAGEVRSLAQRSAEAAREVKSLLGASMERAEAGAGLAANAGRTMAEIVASVQRVSDIVEEISSSSAEQSGGIGQVNQAVSQLDRMTQENAALVEQSTAAAESLQQQAQRLGGLVQTFRLGAAAA